MGVIEDVLSTKTLSDLQVSKTVVVPSVPKLTKVKVESTVKLLKDVAANNGHLAIAKKVGLSQRQVAQIHQKMFDKIVELKPKDIVE